jgi:hypothetical protein
MPDERDGQEPIDIAKTQQSIREGIARAAELVDRVRRLVKDADTQATAPLPSNERPPS